MPWDGIGTYNPPAASFPEVNGTTIDAARFNPTILDLAAGITAALHKGGQNSPTANLPMGGFKHTGAASATAAGQYLTFGQNGTGVLQNINIDSTGRVGIGVAPAVGTLEVRASSPTLALSNSSTRYAFLQWNESISALRLGTDGAFPLVFSTQGFERLQITSDGRLYGTALHNNAGSVAGATNQYIASGTYTPTLTNVSNTTARTPGVCQWMRVGNVVTVSGALEVTYTGLAGWSLRMSLPIASEFTSFRQCTGTGVNLSVADGEHCVVSGEDVEDEAVLAATFSVNPGASQTIAFHFTYLVVA